ncbi:hypothetical protein XENOCAPTIV_020392, partial [Xenoophorus captivus]
FNMDIRHIKITSCEGLYRINDKKAFRGLIVSDKYSHKALPHKCFKNVNVMSSPFMLQCGLCLTGGSIRSFGLVRARYDYSARDRTELSLREGDTIKILSKKGHSGWWKGEVYGRVRLSGDLHMTTENSNIWRHRVLIFTSTSRWAYFHPIMWRRITLITADFHLHEIF